MQAYTGRCHCGAIGFEYRTAVAPEDWSVRACSCSYCRAHDARSLSDPEGSLRFVPDAAEMPGRYRFGLKTADFLFCTTCGVYIGAVTETGAGCFGIVNAHVLDPQPDALAAPVTMHYDGEDSAARGRRREQRWTPVVD